MITLVRVELTRLRWRRAVVLLGVAAVVIPGIILAALLYDTRPVSVDDRRAAEEQASAEAAQPYVLKDIARCERNPQRYGVRGSSAEAVAAACEDSLAPRAEWYLSRNQLDLTEQREAGGGIAVALVLTMLALLVGTTYAGHDWNSGSVSNQLLFEPRRTRVWVAKGLVVLLVAGAVSLAVLVAFWTGLVVAAESRDVAIADHAVVAAYKQAVLGAGFAALTGVGGYALTMLLRSTVATLGVLFAFAAVGSLLIAALGITGSERIQPQNNYTAFLVGSSVVYDYERPGCQDGGGRDCATVISRAQSTGYWGVLLGIVVVPSLISFRRRDVP